MIATEPKPATRPAPVARCGTCGETRDLVTRYYHVGGHDDYQPRTECRNVSACWARHDWQQARKA